MYIHQLEVRISSSVPKIEKNDRTLRDIGKNRRFGAHVGITAQLNFTKGSGVKTMSRGGPQLALIA